MGCNTIPKLKDLTGKTFGRLKVIERADDAVTKTGRHRTRWLCLCDCGNFVIVYADNIMSEKSTSCGCLRKEMLSNKRTTHGCSKERLYGIWCAMKRRCYNTNDIAYKDYGGRGISICEEWKQDYQAFRNWALDSGYSNEKSIDRINNSGNYEPDNCRWVVSDVQANNRRSNRVYTVDGETHTLTEWANIRGINPKTLFTRIYSGLDFISALNY